MESDITKVEFVDIIEMKEGIITKILVYDRVYELVDKPDDLHHVENKSALEELFESNVNKLSKKKIKLQGNFYGKKYPSYFNSVMTFLYNSEKVGFTKKDVTIQFPKINTTQFDTLMSFMIEKNIIVQMGKDRFQTSKNFNEIYKEFDKEKK